MCKPVSVVWLKTDLSRMGIPYKEIFKSLDYVG